MIAGVPVGNLAIGEGLPEGLGQRRLIVAIAHPEFALIQLLVRARLSALHEVPT